MTLGEVVSGMMSMKFYAGLVTGALISKTIRASIKEAYTRKFQSQPDKEDNNAE